MKKTIWDLYPGKLRRNASPKRFPGVVGDCWEWTGPKDGAGYGVAGRYTAHRYSFIIEHGSIRPNLCVCHKCDIRPCCNPDHLFLGTNEQNLLDRWKWSFVVDGKFIPGDYDHWREDVLFKSCWLTSKTNSDFVKSFFGPKELWDCSDEEKVEIEKLWKWMDEAMERPHLMDPIPYEKLRLVYTVSDCIELVKNSYKFTTMDGMLQHWIKYQHNIKMPDEVLPPPPES